MTIIPEQIVSYTVKKAVLDKDYVWKSAKSLLGITFQKEGFYFVFIDSKYMGPTIENEESYTAGTQVFTRPRVILRLSDGRQVVQYFKTEEAQQEFVERLPKGIEI